ncbi:phosphohydrolase [Seonamhaeicola marinus]|uniref:Phosphohydrolase n=1 Tax=Seonamhaeicola marinus TaxID=1912246 RepID=A0A5D0IKU5_9FLAO|nr:phosphohydrolase [Seonamhaeicola marinus]
MLEKTKDYAIKKHKDVNQKYGDYDYDFHLNMVYETAQKFIHIIAPEERENVLAACWVHDVIEDARETYNDVKNVTNTTIAELAYALTNEKGRTRAERANDKYYRGIRETKNASFIKFCDRIANVTHSKNKGSKMYKTYKNENEAFVSKIYVPECASLSEHLINLFKD